MTSQLLINMNTNKANTGASRREDIYIYICRLERLVKDLSMCLKDNIEPDFSCDDDAQEYGEYAEKIYAYVRATHDEQVMIDSCKINRYSLYKVRISNDEVGRAIRKARRYLMEIHDYTLTEMWGVSRDDVENGKYYINSVEGVCRNSTTGELLPRPTEDASQPLQTGFPSELDIPEFYKCLAKGEASGIIKKTSTGYDWKGNKKELALFGELASEKFNIKNKWKVFENLFRVKGLANAKYKASEVDGRFGDHEKIIRGMFDN